MVRSHFNSNTEYMAPSESHTQLTPNKPVIMRISYSGVVLKKNAKIKSTKHSKIAPLLKKYLIIYSARV